MKNRLENSIQNDKFEDYEQIKLDAIAFKNRLEDSQLFYNVAKHKMHMKLIRKFYPKIEIEVQVANLVTRELRMTNDIYENRILEADKKINKQAEEKKDLQSKIEQMQSQMDQLQNQNDQLKGQNDELQIQLQQVTSQMKDSESAKEELKSQNAQLAEQKITNEEAIAQLQRGMLSFKLIISILRYLVQFVAFSSSIIKTLKFRRLVILEVESKEKESRQLQEEKDKLLEGKHC
jgi:chromosome segregation ATPase